MSDEPIGPPDPFGETPVTDDMRLGYALTKNAEYADRMATRQDEFNDAQCATLYAAAFMRLCIGAAVFILVVALIVFGFVNIG